MRLGNQFIKYYKILTTLFWAKQPYRNHHRMMLGTKEYGGSRETVKYIALIQFQTPSVIDIIKS